MTTSLREQAQASYPELIIAASAVRLPQRVVVASDHFSMTQRAEGFKERLEVYVHSEDSQATGESARRGKAASGGERS